MGERNQGIAIPKPSPKNVGRFLALVDVRGPDECWPYKGTKRGGYGQVSRTIDGKRRMLQANRYAYAIAHDGVATGVDVLHRCDNPPCCNPAHLREGSHDDNMREKGERNRVPGKVPIEEVMRIRADWAAGIRQVDIAARCGVSQYAISLIVTGKSFKHLPLIPKAS